MNEKKSTPQFDWEKIEAEYRAGVLSLREIARIHGCTDTAIRKKAKACGWTRDLSKKIEEAVRSKLVRTEVRIPAATEREVVDAEADLQVRVRLEHRRGWKKLRELEDRLLDELGGEGMDAPKKLYITQYQGQIVQKEVGLTVSEKASTLLSLANVRARRIEMERKAFNMDGDRGDEGKGDGLAELIAEIHANSRRGLPSEEL